MNTKSTPQPRGFTLIELLVVVAIIAILASFSVPVINRVMERARATEARAMVSDLQIAVTQYYSEYNRLPAPTSNDDTQYNTISNNDLVAVLLGENRSIGSIQNANPRRTAFIEPKYAKNVGASGQSTWAGGLVEVEGNPQLVDPWGNAYQIKLDTNYDNLIDNPLPESGPNQLRRRVLVWSQGIPGRDSPITSWE